MKTTRTTDLAKAHAHARALKAEDAWRKAASHPTREDVPQHIVEELDAAWAAYREAKKAAFGNEA